MGNVVAVMNTKGGVGKSTLVMALAETLSVYHSKMVLVIDSDAQASLGHMLIGTEALLARQNEDRSLVSYLVANVLQNNPVSWRHFVANGVSDVDDARSVCLIPSDPELTLFEREISREQAEERLRNGISDLLADLRRTFEVILIDCPPGLSVLTECWLREADFHVAPTKPDYVSVCGLQFFKQFKQRNPELTFARNLGVVVNMKGDAGSDTEFSDWLASEPENRCFRTVIPRSHALQSATLFKPDQRSYLAKYPGESGRSFRQFADEFLARLAAHENASQKKFAYSAA